MSPARPDVKPVRQMLRVPADPGGQRAILVILIHGREVTPFADRRWRSSPPRIRNRCGTTATGAGKGWLATADASRPKPGRSPEGAKKQADEARAQQHPVRLIGSENLQGGNERKKRQARQTSSMARGQKFSTSSTEATIPSQHNQTAKRASRCRAKTASARTRSATHRPTCFYRLQIRTRWLQTHRDQ